jgi:hypothetical protein
MISAFISSSLNGQHSSSAERIATFLQAFNNLRELVRRTIQSRPRENAVVLA